MKLKYLIYRIAIFPSHAAAGLVIFYDKEQEILFQYHTNNKKALSDFHQQDNNIHNKAAKTLTDECTF